MPSNCTQQFTDFDFRVDDGKVVLGLQTFYLQGYVDSIPDPIDVKTTAECANECLKKDDCIFWWHVAEHTISAPNDILGCLLFDTLDSTINQAINSTHTASWFPWVRNTGGGFGQKCSNFEAMPPYHRDLDQCVGGKPAEPSSQLKVAGGVVSDAVPKTLANWSHDQWANADGWVEHPVFEDGCALLCLRDPNCNHWAYIPERPDSDDPDWKDTYLCSVFNALPDGFQDDLDNNNWADIDGAQFGNACWGYTTTTTPAPPIRPSCTLFQSADLKGLYMEGAYNTGNVMQGMVPSSLLTFSTTNASKIESGKKNLAQACSNGCAVSRDCNYWAIYNANCWNWTTLPDVVSSDLKVEGEKQLHIDESNLNIGFGVACSGDFKKPKNTIPNDIPVCHQSDETLTFGDKPTGRMVVNAYPDVSALPKPSQPHNVSDRDTCSRACVQAGSCKYWIWDGKSLCYLLDSVTDGVNNYMKWNHGVTESAFGEKCQKSSDIKPRPRTMPECRGFHMSDRQILYIDGAYNTGNVVIDAVPIGIQKLAKAQSTPAAQTDREDGSVCKDTCYSDYSCKYFALYQNRCYKWSELPKEVLANLEDNVLEYKQQWVHSDWGVFGLVCEGDIAKMPKADDIQPPNLDDMNQCQAKLKGAPFSDKPDGSVVLGSIPSMTSIKDAPDPIPHVKSRDACTRTCLELPTCNYWVWVNQTKVCYLWKEWPATVDTDQCLTWSEDEDGGFGQKCKYFETVVGDKMSNYHCPWFTDTYETLQASIAYLDKLIPK